MRRFSPVIHIRLAPIHSFTLAQWPTVCLRRWLFPGTEQLWRQSHVSSFWKAWMKAAETHLLYSRLLPTRCAFNGIRMSATMNGKQRRCYMRWSITASHASGICRLSSHASWEFKKNNNFPTRALGQRTREEESNLPPGVSHNHQATVSFVVLKSRSLASSTPGNSPIPRPT